jgi:hypothetical protein
MEDREDDSHCVSRGLEINESRWTRWMESSHGCQKEVYHDTQKSLMTNIFAVNCGIQHEIMCFNVKTLPSMAMPAAINPSIVVYIYPKLETQLYQSLHAPSKTREGRKGMKHEDSGEEASPNHDRINKC